MNRLQAQASELAELVTCLQRLSSRPSRGSGAAAPTADSHKHPQTAAAPVKQQQGASASGQAGGARLLPGSSPAPPLQPATLSPAAAAAAAAAHARHVACTCLAGVTRGLEGLASDSAAVAFASGAAAAAAEEEEDAARAAAAASEAACDAARVFELCWPGLFAGFSQILELSPDDESQARA